MGYPNHDHRFEGTSVDEVFEDGAFIVHERCEYAPVTNQWTDDARDETYTETGPRCEAVRRTRLDPTLVETNITGHWHTLLEHEETVWKCYDESYAIDVLLEDCDDAARKEHMGEDVDADVSIERDIVRDGYERVVVTVNDTFRVTYDNKEVTLDRR